MGRTEEEGSYENRNAKEQGEKKGRNVFGCALLGFLLLLPARAQAASDTWLMGNNYSTGFAGGTGTQEDAYQISTPEQLAHLAFQVNIGTDYKGKYFILTADLDLSAHEWVPIGEYKQEIKFVNGSGGGSFKGHFDGGNHRISGLTIGSESSPNSEVAAVGLFGCIKSGTIKNLAVVDVAIYSSAKRTSKNEGVQVGSLVGYNLGRIENCYSTGMVVAGSVNVGGLVGNHAGTIENAYSTVTVVGGVDAAAGGLAGLVFGNIKNAYATGAVTTSGEYGRVGGLVGHKFHGMIERCYSTGDVIGGGSRSRVGGLIGQDTYQGEVISCYWLNDALQQVGGIDRTPEEKIGGKSEIPEIYEDDELPREWQGLTRKQMTGTEAERNIKGFDFSGHWVATAGISSSLPQLKVFAQGTMRQKEDSLKSVDWNESPTSAVLFPGLSDVTIFATRDSNRNVIVLDLDKLSAADRSKLTEHIKNSPQTTITLDISNVEALRFASGLEVSADPAWVSLGGKTLAFFFSGKEGNAGFAINDSMLEAVKESKQTGPVKFLLSLNEEYFSISQNGTQIPWRSYENPVILRLPFAYPLPLPTGFPSPAPKYPLEDNAVMYQGEGYPRHVIPRSWYADDMVHAKVYSTGEFSDGYVKSEVFPDVKGQWMERAVNYMAVRGVVNGVDETHFSPDASVTRAEFVTMLMRMLDVDVTEQTFEAGFADRDRIPDWALPYIAKAKTLGIIKGDEGNNFNPHGRISRQDMFVMTYRAMERMKMLPLAINASAPIFADREQIADYAVAELENLVKLGLAKGSDGKIHPTANSSRGEAAQFLFNILEFDSKH